ncbi:MAG: tyrosine-type recombinase/integrase [Pseudomonadota bacterium]
MCPPEWFGRHSNLEKTLKVELTERLLVSLLKKKPEQGRIEYSDTKRRGLRLRISSTGRASWVFEKRVKGGVKRKHTLGSFPAVGLSDARAMALELEAEAARGVDRVKATRVEKARLELEAAKLITVQQVLDRYRDLHLCTIRTGDERYRQISQSLEPHLQTSIKDLLRKDLQAAVDTKAQEGRRPYANRIRAALVAFANWAFLRGYIDEPIGAGVAKAVKEVHRDRKPSIDEVRQIWAATLQMGDVWGPFFRVLILTGQRRGEIANLRWSEVDFANRQIVKPGRTTKNRQPHITHLSDATLAELEALATDAEQSEFVFSFDGVRPVANPSHAKARLDKLLGEEIEPWRLHDLRTAMASALNQAKQPEHIVDRILNHAATGSAPSAVSRVYNLEDMLPQRAAALDLWAEMVTDNEAVVSNRQRIPQQEAQQ